MVITRFAPSPTGFLHVGNLRTALFNYLIAKKAGGSFILRLDDTDPVRSTVQYADAIQEDLEWLGIEWGRVERQSARLDSYENAADDLREKERFYEAFETPLELDLKRKKQLNMGKPPVYDRSALKLSEDEIIELKKDRTGHWRFLLNHDRINWNDGILGDISIDAASVSDPVLIRGDGQVLYTLASVVDDLEMGVTHVVRGADHVTNTATQIQIMEALGHETPTFAHHSLLTGPQGEGLSKRLGTLALRDLREAGIEPMALLSHLARLGSSDPMTLFTNMDELTDGFDVGSFGAAPTKFDVADLTPLTAKYLGNLPYVDVKTDLRNLNIPDDIAEPFWDAIKQNITIKNDISDWWDICQNGAEPLIDPEDADYVKAAIELMPAKPWDEDSWKSWTAKVKEQTGRKGKQLFMPLRKALTGKPHGPDMSRFMALMQTDRF